MKFLKILRWDKAELLTDHPVYIQLKLQEIISFEMVNFNRSKVWRGEAQPQICISTSTTI